jgi:hypothetical protein
MAVLVRQVCRPVRDDRVELLARAASRAEVGHRPAAAEDPRLVGMGLDVAGSRASTASRPRRLVELALEALDADEIGWTWASWNPGSRSGPARSTTRLCGPTRSATSRAEPTATIRLPADGDRLRDGRRRRPCGTWPPVRTRSAGPSGEVIAARIAHERGAPRAPSRALSLRR